MMALPLLRCSIRPVSLLGRCFSSYPLFVNHSKALAPATTAALRDTRRYCSEPRRNTQNKVVVLGIPNPLTWFKNKIYFFLIQSFFDKEFSIEDFKEGAVQAFSHVSRLLSQSQFTALEGLVTDDVIQKLEEKCVDLPQDHQRALAVDLEDVLYMKTGDVGIYYDDNERRFVSILMRFWYLTSARLPEDGAEDAKMFRVSFGENGANKPEAKRLLTANYEFQREFTEGVTADWIITRIEHSKLID